MYLQRHGESEANEQRVYSCVKLDPALTENGKKQIESYLEYYNKLQIDNIVSSPSKRAIETAEIIAHNLGLPITLDKTLHEVDMGDLEGEPQDEESNIKLFTSIIDNWLSGDGKMKFPNGESYIDVKERIDHVVKNYMNRKNILLVAHATFFACLMGQQLKYKNSIFEIFLPHAGRAKYENGNWIMIDTR